MPDYATLYSGLNIEKVSRTATGLHFAVNAYFRQSCKSTPWNCAAARSLFEDVPAPIFGKVPRKAVVKRLSGLVVTACAAYDSHSSLRP